MTDHEKLIAELDKDHYMILRSDGLLMRDERLGYIRICATLREAETTINQMNAFAKERKNCPFTFSFVEVAKYKADHPDFKFN